VRQLFLIRHGETVGNASRTVQQPDSPLSARGLAQADRLARRLASERGAAARSGGERDDGHEGDPSRAHGRDDGSRPA